MNVHVLKEMDLTLLRQLGFKLGEIHDLTASKSETSDGEWVYWFLETTLTKYKSV